MNSIHDLIRSLYIPSDRTFSAHSEDGINWTRDKGVRLEKGRFIQADNSFYCFIHQPEDLAGIHELYFHTSTRSKDAWITCIQKTQSADGMTWQEEKEILLSSDRSDCEFSQIRAPYVKKFGDIWRLFFSARQNGKPTGIYSAMSQDRKAWKIEPGSRVSVDLFTAAGDAVDGVSDTSIIDLPDGTYRMFFSVYRESVYKQNICSARSKDGLRWEIEPGVRVNFGSNGCRFVTNNPSVIQIDGLWNMYFRGSNNMPIKDKIFRAISKDSMDWEIKGPVLTPNPLNLKERHEVAHPYVYKTQDGFFRMYYTGCGGTILDRFAFQYYENHYRQNKIPVIYD